MKNIFSSIVFILMAEKKSICYVQGSTHGYVPPEPKQMHVDRKGETK